VNRADSRAIAGWLNTHASGPNDLVVSGYHSLDFYYPHVAYFYTDEHDGNFEELACRRGSVDRWSNLPLLYNAGALREQVATRGQAFVVMFSNRIAQLKREAPELRPAAVWSTQNVSIVQLQRPQHRSRCSAAGSAPGEPACSS
jgi:hypothetical protein